MTGKQLPDAGADWATLKGEMLDMAAGDANWRGLKTAVYVFNAGDEAALSGGTPMSCSWRKTVWRRRRSRAWTAWSGKSSISRLT